MSASMRSPSSLENPCLRALLYDPGGADLRLFAASRCCLPRFLTASASTSSLRGSITRPACSLSTLRLRVAPPTQDSLPAVPSALAGRAWLPAGFHLEVSAHGILLNQVWLAHQEGGKVREDFLWVRVRRRGTSWSQLCAMGIDERCHDPVDEKKPPIFLSSRLPVASIRARIRASCF
jgi:hypothetical protein